MSAWYLDFYKVVIDLFFSFGDEFRFRCIVVEAWKVNFEYFHEEDAELGFYKFYYQLLHHWIYINNSYNIFTDIKTSRVHDRLKILERCLQKSNLTAQINCVQALRSKVSVSLQMADLFVGLVSAKFNNSIQGNDAKKELIAYCENHLGWEIGPTVKGEKKFNIFKINLSERW